LDMSKIEFSVADTITFEAINSRRRTCLVQPSDLSPLEAYMGLNDLFGEPDMEVFDEDKQQWIFGIRAEGAHLEVYDYKFMVGAFASMKNLIMMSAPTCWQENSRNKSLMH
jgi:hypothetical protein